EANIGHKLARNLGMQVGDSAYLIGSQFDGSMSGIKIKLVGIFQASDTELDTSRVFINLKSAKKLFAPDNSEENITRYTSLALGIRNHREAELIFQNLKKQYPLPALEKGELREESENFEPVALNWEDLNPGILQFVLLDQIQGEMSIAFLILILAFGVLNTVQMSIQERIREFGSLLAIGTKPFDIQKMIVYEVLLILSPAIFLGNLIAIFYANYLDKHPIVLTGNTADAYADLGFLPVLKAIADPKEMWIGVLSLLIPSLIFTVLATRRLYRLNPVEIINS
ncbi:MAG: ABC transporter permease, partial [Leptospiraceae bacterium]|nr:ABC transporter permease [Leptospiraceae bacterium]